MDLIPGQPKWYFSKPSRLPSSMKMRKKNPSENLTTSTKEIEWLKNMSMNSDSWSAKQDCQLIMT